MSATVSVNTRPKSVYGHRLALASGHHLASQHALGCLAVEELARNLALSGAEVRRQPGFDTLFRPGGALLRAGDPMRQPALATVLEGIAHEGERAFYEGDAMRSLVRFSQDGGGLFAPADFARAQADWVGAWSAPAAGHVVHVMPPNSVGVLMLLQLRHWEQGGRLDGVDGTAQDIAHAIAVAAEGRAGVGDTTGFVAMDAQGHALAMLQSVFQPLGSGAVDPGTGILLNNRMFDFSATPGGVNSVAPHRRPSHTLNPWLVLRDGRATLAAVSPGGVSQTTTGFQIAAAALAGSATLGEVVAQPRWSLARDGTVLLESGMAPDVAERLRARPRGRDRLAARVLFRLGQGRAAQRRGPGGRRRRAAPGRGAGLLSPSPPHPEPFPSPAWSPVP